MWAYGRSVVCENNANVIGQVVRAVGRQTVWRDGLVDQQLVGRIAGHTNHSIGRGADAA